MRRPFVYFFLLLTFAIVCSVSCDDSGNQNSQGGQPPGAMLPGATLGVAPAPVSKTGQVSCWASSSALISCTGTGQDGDIRAGVAPPDPRFTDNGNGTITDNLTGLVWLKNANCKGGKSNWAGALQFANTLKDGDCGLSDGSKEGDWHLPNVRQLYSLIDFEKYNVPTNNPFMNLQSDSYWSSTTRAPLKDFAWVVGFGGGGVGGDEKDVSAFVTAVHESMQTDAAPAPVIVTGQKTCRDSLGFEIACAGTGQDGDIRAGVASPDPRFTDNGNGTITDNLTGLVWLKNADCFGSHLWDEALRDANTLKDGDCGLSDGSKEGDWHLPNVRQLESLLDYKYSSNYYSLDLPPSSHFSKFSNQEYWTSTTNVDATNDALTITFGIPVQIGGSTKNDTNDHILPVRNGK